MDNQYPNFHADPFPYANDCLNKFIKYNCGILLRILPARIRGRQTHVNVKNNGDITVVDSGNASELVLYGVYLFADSIVNFDDLRNSTILSNDTDVMKFHKVSATVETYGSYEISASNL